MSSRISHTQSSVRNSVANIVLQCVTIISGFLVPRLFGQYYGAPTRGAMTAINDITTYLSLIEAGLANAAIQSLYAPLRAKDWDGTSSILSASRRFYNQIASIFTGSVLLLAFVYPYITERNGLSISLITGMFLILGLSSSLEYFIYNKYSVLLTADRKLYIISNVSSIGLALSTALRVLLILNHFSVYYVLLVPGIVYFARALFLMFYVKRRYSQLNPHAHPNKAALSKRWSVMYHQVAGLVLQNTDTILLSIYWGFTYVSVYTAYNFVFRSIIMLLNNAFSQSALAGFGHIIAEDDSERLQKTYRTYEALYYMVVPILYAVTAVMLLPFITLYTKNFTDTGGLNYADPLIGLLFLTHSIANNLRVPPLLLINAKGHFKETRNRALLEAGINLTVSLILVKPLGIYGVLIGTIASFLYRTLDIIFYSNHRILQQSVKQTFLRCLRALLIVAGIALLFYRPVANAASQAHFSWLDWAGWSALLLVCSTACTLAVNYFMEKETVKELFTRLGGVMKRHA